MLRVSPEIPRVHKFIKRFASLNDLARMDEVPTIHEAFLAGDKTKLMKTIGAKTLKGHEGQVYDAVLGIASWYTGRRVIGCGLDSLVTRKDSLAVKFATTPMREPERLAVELKRRFDIARGKLGEYMLDTNFEPGKTDGSNHADTVVMTQPYLDCSVDALDTVDPIVLAQIADFRARALELVERKGLIVDVFHRKKNLVFDPESGCIKLVDAVVSSLADDGSTRPLSEYAANSASDIDHIVQLPA